MRVSHANDIWTVLALRRSADDPGIDYSGKAADSANEENVRLLSFCRRYSRVGIPRLYVLCRARSSPDSVVPIGKLIGKVK
jgi:hypothetical protein